MKRGDTDTAPLRVITAGSAWVHASTSELDGEGVFVERRLTANPASIGNSSLESPDGEHAVDCVLTDDLDVVAAASDDHPVVFAVERASDAAVDDALAAGATEVLTRADCDRTTVLRNRLSQTVRRVSARRAATERKAWYESLLEHSSSGLVVLDERDRLTYVSPAMETVTGYRPRDLLGAEFVTVVDEADRDAVRSTLETVRADDADSSATCEYRSTREDGTPCIHEAVFTDRRAGTTGGIVASVRDVTAYHRVERELNESFDRVTDAFLALDNEWQFSYVNERAEEILGHEESELLGRTFLEVFPEAADTEFESASIAAAKSQEPQTVESYYEPYDRWIEARVYPSPTGISAYFRDVTERVERDHAFVERTERLETLVEHVPTVLFALDPEGTFILSEGLGLEQIGYESGEAVGESVFDVFEQYPTVLADVERALEGEPVHSTHRYGGRAFETWYRPITREGTLERVIGVSVDVTEREQYEQTLNALHEATRHLLSVDSKQAACEYIVDVSADVLDLTGALVYRFDEQENELVPAAYSADLPEAVRSPPRFQPNDSIIWRVFVDGEPSLFADVRESAFVHNPETTIRGGLYIPLGEHGVLVAISTEVGQYDETTFELAQLFAATAEAALDRIGRSQRLTERERELRQQNERLEALHRSSRLREEIESLLLRADTRQEIETGVCERLSQLEECAFAWIGEPDPSGSQVVPQATAGADRGYLEAVDAMIVDDSAAEPAGRAAKSGHPVTEQNVASTLRDGRWRGEALSRDFQSVYAVPVVHDGFLYGVLTVYARRRRGFDDVFRSTLAEIGETIAYTIQAVQRKNSLIGDEVTELELAVDDESALSTLANEFEATVTLEGVITRTDETTVVFVSVDAVLSEEALTGVDAVETPTIIGSSEGRTMLQLRLEEPFLGSIVDGYGGVLQEFVVTESEARAVVTVPRSVEIRELFAALGRRGVSVSLIAKRERSRSEETDVTDGVGRPLEASLLDDLTERQREVVQTAYHGGFFEWPRTTTGEEVAASLDISPPAFHNHVRAVERKLFDALFGRDHG